MHNREVRSPARKLCAIVLMSSCTREPHEHRGKGNMEIDIFRLRALFEPFDVYHLLRLWAFLALFIMLFGIMVTTSGGYAHARQFWKIHCAVLGAASLLSGLGFLLFHLDPLLLLMSLPCAALIVQGDLGLEEQETPLEEWWLYRFHKRQREAEEEREPEP